MCEAESNSPDQDIDLRDLFPEYHVVPLSDRDRDFFLELLENPPEPTAAFLKAAASYKKGHPE
jgi:uncharacterized protein (DUF1778 family)